MSNYKLVALDLDGTLFNRQSQISQRNLSAISAAIQQGVQVVISTGRPFCGLPFDQIRRTGITYSINTNGASIYEIASGKCIFEDGMPADFTLPIIQYLLTKDIHFDAFIAGNAYSPEKCLPVGKKLTAPPALKKYILDTRTRYADFPKFISENPDPIQKMTLNFYPLADGSFKDREEVKAYLLARGDLNVVSGGYNNLEFTKNTIDKGIGLQKLCQYLGIDVADSIAIGDTGNDCAIIKAAGLGIAMGNATEDVLAVADAVTASNEEDGVALAIEKYCL